ncbi:hypothetical protein [Desulfofundulus thermosubterraneus]|uniref:hypothetical protein n=1 Tax=Desulfofundulus thermosubterraneus TaxID=348840 RepID=UPI001041E109|nr:hypothetical protein [Desulfofundulus thermosubterraneus]
MLVLSLLLAAAGIVLATLFLLVAVGDKAGGCNCKSRHASSPSGSSNGAAGPARSRQRKRESRYQHRF